MRNARGFTLIELLVVMAILGILSGIAIPSYLGQREKARRMVLVASARSVETEVAVMLNSYSIGAPLVLLLAPRHTGCYESGGARRLQTCSDRYPDLPLAGTYMSLADALRFYVKHNASSNNQGSPYDGAPILTDQPGPEFRDGHVLVAPLSDSATSISAWISTGSMVWNSPASIRFR